MRRAAAGHRSGTWKLQKKSEAGAERRSLQGSAANGRNRSARFTRARSDCESHSLVAGMERAERARLCPYIYIHGTPEERNIGLPASYGCVRMRSRDVIQLYDVVGEGAQVTIVDVPLEAFVPEIAICSRRRSLPWRPVVRIQPLVRKAPTAACRAAVARDLRASNFMSASTMIRTSSWKRTFGSQSSTRFAFDASPMSRSTSAGRS